MAFSVFIEIGEAFFVVYRAFFRFQPFQNLIEDLHVVVVDLEIIRQFKTDIVSSASLCPADADHQMIPFRDFLSSGNQVVERHPLLIQNIFLAEHIGKVLDLSQDLVVFLHQAGSLLLILNGSGHVADKSQFAPEKMSVRLRVHQHA